MDHDMMLDRRTRAAIGELIVGLDRAGLLAGGRLAPARAAMGGAVTLYPSSWRRHEGGILFMVKNASAKLLLTVGLDGPFAGERTTVNGRRLGIHPLSAENASALRELLPFTAPAKLPKEVPSLGCGDRLGLANPGHLRVVRHYRVSPVLAQQSIRELNLTGRTFTQVIDAASWAALQEGYEGGFGADGDHLKTMDEVRMALDAGATMITLDLSSRLGVAANGGSCPAELSAQIGRVFALGGRQIGLEAAEVEEFRRTYWSALFFIVEADALCRERRGREGYDLEVSVDETSHPTRSADHLLLALVLERMGVQPASIAPRFPGEFQKALDYRGDLAQFAAEFRIHVAIARRFGHKLSIHSGSDKFAVFPTVAQLASGGFHLKTAGTSWLEALRVVACKDPSLFRRIYAQAGDSFTEAKKHYHIMTELDDVPPLEEIPDRALPEFLQADAARQFLHITYGQILRAPDLGPALLQFLRAEEEDYFTALEEHFRRHLEGLGIARSDSDSR